MRRCWRATPIMPSPSLTDRLDITVVFTDIDMPGSMNGLKLAAAIRERWPPIEIIVTTAGLAPDLRSLPARAILLPKPLVPDDAIRTLQSLAAWKTVKRSPASPGRSERQAHAASHSAMRDRDGWP